MSETETSETAEKSAVGKTNNGETLRNLENQMLHLQLHHYIAGCALDELVYFIAHRQIPGSIKDGRKSKVPSAIEPILKFILRQHKMNLETGKRAKFPERFALDGSRSYTRKEIIKGVTDRGQRVTLTAGRVTEALDRLETAGIISRELIWNPELHITEARWIFYPARVEEIMCNNYSTGKRGELDSVEISFVKPKRIPKLRIKKTTARSEYLPSEDEDKEEPEGDSNSSASGSGATGGENLVAAAEVLKTEQMSVERHIFSKSLSSLSSPPASPSPSPVQEKKDIPDAPGSNSLSESEPVEGQLIKAKISPEAKAVLKRLARHFGGPEIINSNELKRLERMVHAFPPATPMSLKEVEYFCDQDSLSLFGGSWCSRLDLSKFIAQWPGIAAFMFQHRITNRAGTASMFLQMMPKAGADAVSDGESFREKISARVEAQPDVRSLRSEIMDHSERAPVEAVFAAHTLEVTLDPIDAGKLADRLQKWARQYPSHYLAVLESMPFLAAWTMFEAREQAHLKNRSIQERLNCQRVVAISEMRPCSDFPPVVLSGYAQP